MLAAPACAASTENASQLRAPDGALFVSEVYPQLLRDCAFSACHGASQRFFQVPGPGRGRLDPAATKPDDPATLDEVVLSYDRARSMLLTSDRVEDAILLRKPLEPSAGGQGHEGVDPLGRNVFATTSDPRYLLLLRWARTSGSPPTAADTANAAALAQTQDAP
jgi:hypothetical protein